MKATLPNDIVLEGTIQEIAETISLVKKASETRKTITAKTQKPKQKYVMTPLHKKRLIAGIKRAWRNKRK